MSTKDGAINGCGIRIIASSEATLPSETVRVVDVSFNVFSPGIGMIKGGMKTTTLAAILARQGAATKTAQVQIKNIWLRPVGGEITRLAGGKVSASPATPGALIYVAGLAEVLPLFSAVFEKKNIQIGVGLIRDDSEMILSGVVAMTEVELEQVADCYSNWMASVTRPK